MDGIFLHAGWRTSGTWLWEKLRSAPGYHGFYEPLHEFLPSMDVKTLATLAPGAWASRHPKISKPYFAEYLPLHDGKGVRGAKSSFGFDGYFSPAGPDLRDYVSGLCEAAGDKAPVLKFTRSQGRIGWFIETFPAVQHVALVRQPWAQFVSGWRCWVEDRNPYFLAAPCLVLERNGAHPEVAALVRALGLPIGPNTGANVVRRLKFWIRAVRLMPPATLYKAHVALWLLNMVAAQQAAALVIDGHEEAAAAAARFGVSYHARERPPAGGVPFPAGFTPAEVVAIHHAALRALKTAPYTALAPWIRAAEAQAAVDLATVARALPPPAWQRAAWGVRAQMARWAV